RETRRHDRAARRRRRRDLPAGPRDREGARGRREGRDRQPLEAARRDEGGDQNAGGGSGGTGGAAGRSDALTAAGPPAKRSRIRSTSTKNTGTTASERNVASSMPPNTVVPSEFRLAAPAPVAISSGITPKMNANDVIRIGRSRTRAACRAA